MDEELPTRWEVELEFVQSLCNVPYLNYLAQNDYLTNPEFLNYLNYLSYWKKPQYSKFLVYPNCLHILTLLQNPEFRKNIVNPDFMNTLMNDMVQRWQNQDDKIFTTSPTEKNADSATGSGKSAENGSSNENANGSGNGNGNGLLDKGLGLQTRLGAEAVPQSANGTVFSIDTGDSSEGTPGNLPSILIEKEPSVSGTDIDLPNNDMEITDVQGIDSMDVHTPNGVNVR